MSPQLDSSQLVLSLDTSSRNLVSLFEDTYWEDGVKFAKYDAITVYVLALKENVL